MRRGGSLLNPSRCQHLQLHCEVATVNVYWSLQYRSADDSDSILDFVTNGVTVVSNRKNPCRSVHWKGWRRFNLQNFADNFQSGSRSISQKEAAFPAIRKLTERE